MLESSGARRRLMALAVGALMAGLVPGAAMATTPTVVGFSVSADLWGTCLSGGPVTSGASVTVSQKRDRRVLVTRTVTAKNGRFTACIKQIQPADALTITSGGRKRALNVPFLDGSLDLAAEAASGAVPFGTTSVDIDVVKVIDGFAVHTYTKSPVPEPDGSWDADFSGDLDVLGGDRLVVRWTSGRGDVFSLTIANPSVWVIAGKAAAAGSGPGGSKATITAKAGATLRSKGTAVIPKDHPWFSVPMKLVSTAIPVAVGDTITDSQLPGKTLTVLTDGLTVDPTSGGSVDATCWEGGRYAVLVNGVVAASGIAGTGGSVREENLKGTDPLPAGTKVTLACETLDAMGQVWTHKVPA